MQVVRAKRTRRRFPDNLVELLRGRAMLLVLYNCEHIGLFAVVCVAASGWVGPFGRGCRSGDLIRRIAAGAVQSTG